MTNVRPDIENLEKKWYILYKCFCLSTCSSIYKITDHYNVQNILHMRRGFFQTIYHTSKNKMHLFGVLVQRWSHHGGKEKEVAPLAEKNGKKVWGEGQLGKK